MVQCTCHGVCKSQGSRVTRSRTLNGEIFAVQSPGPGVDRHWSLPMIQTPLQNAAVLAATHSLGRDLWIDGSDVGEEGVWRFSNGAEMGTSATSGEGDKYSNWAGSEPNDLNGEDVAHMYLSDGRWNDVSSKTTLEGPLLCCDQAEFGRRTEDPPSGSLNSSEGGGCLPPLADLEAELRKRGVRYDVASYSSSNHNHPHSMWSVCKHVMYW